MKSNWNKLPVTETVDRNHLSSGVLPMYGMKIRQMKTSKQTPVNWINLRPNGNTGTFSCGYNITVQNKINAEDESTVHGGSRGKSHFFSADVFHATATRHHKQA